MSLIPQTLRAHRKVIKNYFRYGDADLDPVEYIPIHDKKLLYVVISKVACTSIKATIGKSYGINSVGHLGQDIHAKNKWERVFGKLPKSYSDYYKFVFVRDPFSRLVSCYKDRVILKKPISHKTSYHFKNYPLGIPPNITFDEFVKKVVQIPDYLADRHFKAQSYSIYRKGVKPPDFIGKFETLESDWKKLAKKFGFTETIESLNRNTSNTKSVKKDFKSFYNKELLDLVHDKYKDDIDFFGYQNTYNEILELLEKN